MKEYFTMDDFDFKEKTVVIRVDLNSPYDKESGKIVDSPRIREHARTIKELLKKKAKVIILSHQGRRGEEGFISLSQHAELLSKHVGRNVKFVDDIVGEKALNAIAKLKYGEALLLDNVRFLEEETEKKDMEEHTRGKLAEKLSQVADYYINDAFSVAHRCHASVVGFFNKLPCIAGRVMEREIEFLKSVLFPFGLNIFILGGAKPEDCLAVVEHLLRTKPEAIEKILTGGLLANLFLEALDYDIGDTSRAILEKKGCLKFKDKARELIDDFSFEIIVPTDVAYEKDGKRFEVKIDDLPVDGMIKDIGKRTVRRYIFLVKEARSVTWKGPLGVYEEDLFSYGTKKVLRAVAKSRAFSLIGGGDTSVAIEKLRIRKKGFSYISLAGGALIYFLSGKTMPGIEALKRSYEMFSK